jgi:outer membrane biogenesis lipoprotein LolB
MYRSTQLLVILLLAACSGGKTAKSAADGDSLTERQRDSILAQSRIPGARGVGSAMRAADSASARIRATDSVSP